MSTTMERRSPIGLQRLVTWPLTKDDASALTYGAAYPFDKSLMTATRTPSQVQADQSADDQVVEDVTINTGGQLALGLTAINGEDRTVLYGNKMDGGTVVINKDDLSPYQCVAYMTPRRDGKVNLYKFLKVSFAEQAETHSTMQKGSIAFAATNIQGNYIATIKTGDYGNIRYGVDSEKEKEIVEAWFTEAIYYKPETEPATAPATEGTEP